MGIRGWEEYQENRMWPLCWQWSWFNDQLRQAKINLERHDS